MNVEGQDRFTASVPDRVRDVSARVPPLNFEHPKDLCTFVFNVSRLRKKRISYVAERKPQVRDAWACLQEGGGWEGSVMVLENVDVTTRATRMCALAIARHSPIHLMMHWRCLFVPTLPAL